MGDLDGKVAIVTGAARGLGRVFALQLASQGARLVVNDLGTALDGGGRDEGPAQEVVDEIKRAGGEAVAHFGDVADWGDSQGMIQTAIDSFGDLDILVNNAGVMRDNVLFSMTEEEFDIVIRTHLKGHFCGMRHASAYWRERSKEKGAPVYGRIINSASEAWLMGNAGQPNYAAAKAGIVALTMSAARVVQKYGVTANVIMPRARTRMTSSGPWAAIFAKPEDGFDNFAPENAGPLVGYLASPRAERVSGYLFIVWAREVTIVGKPTKEPVFTSEDAWSVDALDEKLGPWFAEHEPIDDGFALPMA
jgi:3-oxoacyl-[acyl-carrier protein] reductase